MDPRIVHSQPLRVQAISGMKREFHIARAIRDRFDFKEELFSSTGSVIFQSIHAVRLFVQKFNDGIDLVKYPERAMRAGHLNAMGLIDEIFHFVIQLYREHTGLEPFIELVSALQNSLGAAFEEALIQFVSEFPPREVYAGSLSPEAYVRGKSGEVPNRAIILEELIVLWLTNVNPACDRYKSLFDDANLRRETAYKEIIAAAEQYFRQKPPFGPNSQPLVEMLRSPALSVPHSLSGQLRYMRERWGALLGKYLFRLLSGLDLIREEEKGFVGGPGPTRAYTYSGLGSDHEGFSPDKEWMPTVVLIAKSALVWLDQLAKKYRRTIERLDQIPDEELDILRDRGFTSLWLIGLWERSPASKRIKQLCGNPDAEASAYSIYSYNVSPELGGWEAVQNLRERCLRRSIRLACDMVPNHTGIDSDWVVNRPERFIQLPYAPFPSYTYGGENLASSAGVGIFLEDH
ncbi:MAG TPA: alpha-amylase family glycosyl hydrolase, partial [Spirochaetia bacterium]|nr:alpha-amylase family glycosyl hydrolase [Spirochaetia bacterium]